MNAGSSVAATEHHLGDELLARFQLEPALGSSGLSLQIRADGSLFLPGAALEQLWSSPLWMLHTTVQLSWGGDQ